MHGPGSNKKRNDRVVTKHNFLVSSDENTFNGVSSPRPNGTLKLRMNPYNRVSTKKKFSKVMLGSTEWTGASIWSSVRINTSEALTKREMDACVIDFYNEVGGMATNLLDTVRTRKETIDMISSNLMKIVKSVRLLRKGKWKKAHAALGVSPKGSPRGRDVPARWLELQYGWLPLLDDIYTVGNEFFPDPRFRVRKSVFADLYRFNENRYGTSSIDLLDRYSITGYFKIKGDAVQTMQHLGVLNPLAVAWEAVPFSFVVDWFLPVGDWISSLTALHGISFSEVSVVRCKKSERIGRVNSNPTDPKKVWSECEEYTYSYQRTVGLPSRPFPSFKNPLSIAHFANGMSLLATVFGRK